MAHSRNIPLSSQTATPRGGFETLTRIGMACKGVVYLLIGVLALMTAFGEGGETTDSKGAVGRIAEQPFGEFALAVIGIGLLAYSLWRIMCAFLDVEHEGSGARGMGKRAFYLFSGIAYATTGLYALKLLTGNGASSGDGTASMTAKLMNAPAGTLLVAILGAAILVGGIMQIREGLHEKFRKHLRSLPAGHDWVIRAGKWGYVARGIVFGIIGVFVLQAALRHDPGRAQGLEGALDALARQPYGQILLALVAAGLVCYGAYSLVESRYRTVHVR
ncbi:MAG TPA: DUF1206 domain-containing protein [Bryobacteraceae bacterium]|nr:DUF1206 domain-containing protein [Bryobacteraceae bacterium]